MYTWLKKNRTFVHATCIPWICKHTASLPVKAPSDGSVHSTHSSASHSEPEKPRPQSVGSKRKKLGVESETVDITHENWIELGSGKTRGFKHHVDFAQKRWAVNQISSTVVGSWPNGFWPSKLGCGQQANKHDDCIHQTQFWANQQPNLSVIRKLAMIMILSTCDVWGLKPVWNYQAHLPGCQKVK